MVPRIETIGELIVFQRYVSSCENCWCGQLHQCVIWSKRDWMWTTSATFVVRRKQWNIWSSNACGQLWSSSLPWMSVKLDEVSTNTIEKWFWRERCRTTFEHDHPNPIRESYTSVLVSLMNFGIQDMENNKTLNKDEVRYGKIRKEGSSKSIVSCLGTIPLSVEPWDLQRGIREANL